MIYDSCKILPPWKSLTFLSSTDEHASGIFLPLSHCTQNSGVGQSIGKVEQINLKSANWVIAKIWHVDTNNKNY